MKKEGVIISMIGHTKLYSDVSSQFCNMECNTPFDKAKPASHISSTISRATCTCITSKKEFTLHAMSMHYICKWQKFTLGSNWHILGLYCLLAYWIRSWSFFLYQWEEEQSQLQKRKEPAMSLWWLKKVKSLRNYLCLWIYVFSFK